MIKLKARTGQMSLASATKAPVLIVGAGPVGLALALGLAHHGVRSIVVERKSTTSAQSKAPAIHIRTREIFRQWGVEEPMLAEGVLREHLTMHNATPGQRPFVSLDFSELADETDRPGILFLEQGATERILLKAVRATGMSDVRFDTEVVGLEVDESSASVTVQSGAVRTKLRADYVVGCDGARSFIRQALGLGFEGITYSVRPMLADVLVTDQRDRLPWPRLYNGVDGMTTTVRLRPGHWRIIRLESTAIERDEAVSSTEMQERLAEVLGEGPAEVIWASRFRIHLRHAARFRVGRVMLAGDAAHVHSPAGGLGMNTGIQDAHNLAWKLAYALAGGDAERLLASYDTERRAVAVESVSRYADFLTRAFLLAPRPIRRLAIALLPLLFKIPRARRNALRRATMIGLNYPPSPLLQAEDHRAGWRLPNVMLTASDGVPIRLYDLLGHQPALLYVGPADGADAAAWLDQERLAVTHAVVGPGSYEDRSGKLSALVGEHGGWILVRPDRHIAWVRSKARLSSAAVLDALGLELGEPSPAGAALAT